MNGRSRIVKQWGGGGNSRKGEGSRYRRDLMKRWSKMGRGEVKRWENRKGERSRYRRDVLKGRSRMGKRKTQGQSRKGKRAGWEGGEGDKG
jgi:hypothetical protein